MILRLLVPTFALFVATGGFAASQAREIPGVLEQSGQLILRPKQLQALRESGCSDVEGIFRQKRARLRVQHLMTRYLPNTDDIVISVPSGREEFEFAAELMRTLDYEYVHPNWICFPSGVPNDPQYESQWAWPKIGAPLAWDTTQGDENLIVSNCDTGVQHSHPDLSASLVPGYNSASHHSEEEGGTTEDITGHGTHTAGTLAAIGNNARGVTGETWRCKIMPIRVTNSPGGGATLADILEGAQWAVDHGAKAINCSYPGVTNAAVETTGNYIRSHGGVFCFSAGSSGTQMNSDSDWPDVTIVGATTSSDTRASFSDYGVPLDLMAPGVDILSTYTGNGYAYYSGTSMAAPHAAGAFALLFSKNAHYTPDQVETFLYSTAYDMGTPGNDDLYGWGRVDIGAAMEAANDWTGYHLAPLAFRWVRGAHLSGGLQSLERSDDEYLVGRGNMVMQPGEPIVLEVDIISPTSTPTSLALNLEAHNSQPMLVKIQLKRWSDGVWVDLSSAIVGRSDSVVYVNVPDPAQFVRSSDGLIQARCGVRLGPTGGQPRVDSSFDEFVCDLIP